MSPQSFAISFTSPDDDLLITFSKNLSHIQYQVFQNYLRKSLHGLSLTAKKWPGPTQLSLFQSPIHSTLNAFSIGDPGREEIKGIPNIMALSFQTKLCPLDLHISTSVCHQRHLKPVSIEHSIFFGNRTPTEPSLMRSA